MAPIKYQKGEAHLRLIASGEWGFAIFIKPTEVIIFVGFVRIYSKLSKLMMLCRFPTLYKLLIPYDYII